MFFSFFAQKDLIHPKEQSRLISSETLAVHNKQLNVLDIGPFTDHFKEQAPFSDEALKIEIDRSWSSGRVRKSFAPLGMSGIVFLIDW